jgi:FKBP-type peptidyl-prolyl cis-trans isomerase FkpA/FKBP-type peptidyl-prolyl cis-trans isomerase FklB
MELIKSVSLRRFLIVTLYKIITVFMKHFIYLFAIGLILTSCSGVSSDNKLTSSASSFDSASYAVGVFEGQSALSHLQNAKLDVDKDLLIAGFIAVLKDTAAAKEYTMQWAQETINKYMTKKMEEDLVKVKKENAEFLEKNKNKDSIKVLESGLQYKVITKGTGFSPEISDTVNVTYIGKTIDGVTFDSSRGTTIKMPLVQMIKGWQEGIPLMNPGAKYVFYVPSNLAYGDNLGHQLAGKTLIFEVELISFSKGKSSDTK